MSPTSSIQTAPPAPATGPVMRVHGLRFGYQPGRAVIEAMEAELAPGRLVALIGPNAAGKTTLLRLLLGQLEPWSGRVEVGGRAVAELSARRRAAWLSYVPQRGGAGFAFTVRQVVAMGRYATGPDAAAVERALDACDLTDLAERVYQELSAGQQQRVLLARAVAQSDGGGRAMLLDEPVSSMDLWHAHRTMQRLVQWTRGGPAALVVLHDLNLAARYADDVWLMDRGRLVAAGDWSAVMRPAVLEPVYRVRLRAHGAGDGEAADGRAGGVGEPGTEAAAARAGDQPVDAAGERPVFRVVSTDAIA